jgi:hypothetical protein
MKEDDALKTAQRQHEGLKSAVQGLKGALGLVIISEEERELLMRLLLRIEPSYLEARNNLRKARRDQKSASQELRKIRLFKEKKRKREIDRLHRISGFNKGPGRLLQGGSPGLGKKS